MNCAQVHQRRRGGGVQHGGRVGWQDFDSLAPGTAYGCHFLETRVGAISTQYGLPRHQATCIKPAFHGYDQVRIARKVEELPHGNIGVGQWPARPEMRSCRSSELAESGAMAK